ncbi:MAG: hypothetical protein R3E86_08765 [Pseudomonadales bacterium]
MAEDIEFRQVDESQDPVLRNLLNLYMHDMAEWFLFDSEEDGRYTYATEPLWESGVGVHIAYNGRIPVGFGLVASAAEYSDVPGARDLEEFFVVRRYRREGVGRAFANHLWDLYRGPWVVRVYQRNLPALPFWRATVSAYTDGRFVERILSVRDRPWSYFSFDSAD